MAVIAALTAYFEDKEHEGKFDMDEAHKKFTTYQLEDYHFLYKDATNADWKVSCDTSKT